MAEQRLVTGVIPSTCPCGRDIELAYVGGDTASCCAMLGMKIRRLREEGCHIIHQSMRLADTISPAYGWVTYTRGDDHQCPQPPILTTLSAD